MLVKDQIRIARERKGWSRKQLAEALDVTEQTVCYWEGADKGGRVNMPNKKRAVLLEEALGFTIDWTEGRGNAAGPSALAQVSAEDISMLVDIARLPLDSKRAFRDLLQVHVALVDQVRSAPPGRNLAPVPAFEEKGAVGSESAATRKAAAKRGGGPKLRAG